MADTPSTQPQQGGNAILDLIVGVVERNEPVGSLYDELERAQADVTALRDEITAQHAAQSPAVQQSSQLFADQVGMAIDVYLRALDLIGDHQRDAERLTLIRGGEALRRARYLLDESLLEYRNSVLGSMGPTDIPDYNLLHSHYLKVKAGEAPFDGPFLGLINRFFLMCGEAGNVAFAEPASDARDSALAVYRAHMRALDALRTATQAHDLAGLGPSMDQVRATFTDLRDLIPATQMKVRSSGPTPMPIANFVISMAVEVAAGRVGDGALLDAMQQLRATHADLERQFEAARGRIESVLIEEEAQRVHDALRDVQESLNELDRFFACREGLLLGNACNRLVDAVTRLHHSHEAFLQLAEREHKTLCMRCQHYVDRTRRTCSRCGAPLLQTSGIPSTFQVGEGGDDAGTPQIPVPPNVQRMFEAVNQVAENQITVEEFEAVITWMEGVVQQHSTSHGTRPSIQMDLVPAKDRERLAEINEKTDAALAELAEATELYWSALALFRRYVEEPDRERLLEGCRVMWAGTLKLHHIEETLSDLRP